MPIGSIDADPTARAIGVIFGFAIETRNRRILALGRERPLVLARERQVERSLRLADRRVGRPS